MGLTSQWKLLVSRITINQLINYKKNPCVCPLLERKKKRDTKLKQKRLKEKNVSSENWKGRKRIQQNVKVIDIGISMYLLTHKQWGCKCKLVAGAFLIT